MEPKGSLLHLQVPITWLYHEHNTQYLIIWVNMYYYIKLHKDFV